MTIRLPLTVRYAETDAMGIVHHASYVVWLDQVGHIGKNCSRRSAPPSVVQTGRKDSLTGQFNNCY